MRFKSFGLIVLIGVTCLAQAPKVRHPVESLMPVDTDPGDRPMPSTAWQFTDVFATYQADGGVLQAFKGTKKTLSNGNLQVNVGYTLNGVPYRVSITATPDGAIASINDQGTTLINDLKVNYPTLALNLASASDSVYQRSIQEQQTSGRVQPIFGLSDCQMAWGDLIVSAFGGKYWWIGAGWAIYKIFKYC